MARLYWRLLFVACMLSLSRASQSTKRGLVFIPTSNHPEDDAVWTQTGSDLTWYYNYKSQPSSQLTSSTLSYVPMMWGLRNGNALDTSFLTDVQRLANVTYALSFNEPDLLANVGGSNMSPEVAARCWVSNFVPLQKLGVKVGLPAVSASSLGIPWLQSFLTECASLLGANCTYDFVPIHSYSDFQGLASLIGQNSATFPGKDIWITEYALQNGDLDQSQSFFNSSVNYLDNLKTVTRYSYFGAFRSGVSNVGPNAPFLNNAGQLTDIGAWYLGFNATHVDPESRAFSNSPTVSFPLVIFMAAILLFEL